MSLKKSIEEKIRQAIANGEFDNLAGAGKPLNFDDYFNTLEDVRMGYSVLKSNNFAPEEVKLPPPEAVALPCSHLEGASLRASVSPILFVSA